MKTVTVLQPQHTLSAVVEAVRQAWAESYFPMHTRPGIIFWFRFRVNIGTNILRLLRTHYYFPEKKKIN